jgi:hypothetical protein
MKLSLRLRLRLLPVVTYYQKILYDVNPQVNLHHYSKYCVHNINVIIYNLMDTYSQC